jgi:hypothetical protein
MPIDGMEDLLDTMMAEGPTEDPFDDDDATNRRLDHLDSFGETDRDPVWEAELADEIYDSMHQELHEIPSIAYFDQINETEDEDPWTEEDELAFIAHYIDDPDQGKIMCNACPDLFYPSELVMMPNGERVCIECASEIMNEEANRRGGRKGDDKGKHRTAVHLQMH